MSDIAMLRQLSTGLRPQSDSPLLRQHETVLIFPNQTESHQSINLYSELALIGGLQCCDDGAHRLRASLFKHHHDVAL